MLVYTWYCTTYILLLYIIRDISHMLSAKNIAWIESIGAIKGRGWRIYPRFQAGGCIKYLSRGLDFINLPTKRLLMLFGAYYRSVIREGGG